MDSTLADLDVEVLRVRDAASRAYLMDAIRAYRAGAIRPAITAIWVAVAFDLVSKFRELAAAGDAEAKRIVDDWDRAREASNSERLLKLEKELLDHASRSLQLLDPHALRDLRRLVEDRHLCAHPAFSSEAELFLPSPELVRTHLVNAINLVLAQRPIQGRSILTEFDRDIVSSGFPNQPAALAEYFDRRYLARTRPSTIQNFGTVLAKGILHGMPPLWASAREKVARCLICLSERRATDWPLVRASIVRLINELPPEHRLNALVLLTYLPELMPSLDTVTVNVLEQSIVNFCPSPEADYGFCSAIGVERFREPISRLIATMDAAALSKVVAAAPVLEFWPVALEFFRASGSFRGAEANFVSLISPFQRTLDQGALDNLLDAVASNGQISYARGIPNALLAFLSGASNRPSFAARTALYNALERLESNYSAIWLHFERDGWTRPTAGREPDEDPF